jgi:hypothetical protein
MAKKEMLGEELKLLTEMLKLLWLTLIALIGGTGGLILTEAGFRRAAIIVGLITVFVLMSLIGYLYRRIYSRIRHLEEV